MATQVLLDSLKSVFKHKDFKSKLQREAIECVHEGKLKYEKFKEVELTQFYFKLNSSGLSITLFCISLYKLT